MTKKDDTDFIEIFLQDSEKVQVKSVGFTGLIRNFPLVVIYPHLVDEQIEDIVLREGVQKGLQSPSYCVGRYAPTVEQAMHHFHCLLYENLAK